MFEAGTVDEAKKLSEDAAPAFATVDLMLDGGSGIEFLQHVKSQALPIKCLVVTQYDELLFQVRARAAGALGYITKAAVSSDLTIALRTIRNGDYYPLEFGNTQAYDGVLADMTNREIEIFHCLGRGMTVAEIAEAIGRSRKTVEAFRDRIRMKLKVPTSARLTRIATHWYLEKNQLLSDSLSPHVDEVLFNKKTGTD